MVSQVGVLVPGVTAVTPHARYYTLHTLIADEAQRRGLVAAEAQQLLRRAEVVLAAVSLAHDCPDGFGKPHGGDRIRRELEAGEIDLPSASAPGAYAQSAWGFWGPYRGPEALLGLTGWQDKGMATGPEAPLSSIRQALNPILDLARRETLTAWDIANQSELCLCRCRDAADGASLRAILLQPDADPASNAGRRSATIKLLLRGFQVTGIDRVTADLAPWVAFDEDLMDDPVCGTLQVTRAWRGVVLRSWSVLAWRDLWAELVNYFDGLSTVAGLAEPFADSLPECTVRQFRDGLPAVDRDSRPLPAEIEPGLEDDYFRWCVSLLFLGAARVGRLEERVAAYFESPREAHQELTPSWLAERLEEWADRPIRDFAVWLTQLLVARSQRVALRKARFDKKRGEFLVPSRVFVRDELIFRDTVESGGAVGFRWGPLTTVMAGAGLCHRVSDGGSSRWVPTSVGGAVLE